MKINGKPAWNRHNVDLVRLRDLYVDERRPVTEIAVIFRVSIPVVYHRLALLGVTRTNSESHLGQRPVNFKGRYIEKRSGYVVVHVAPDSLYACMAIRMGSGAKALYVREHRLVVAEHLGRPLERWEVVNHKNHIKADNRIENLELLQSQTYHHGETIMHRELLRLKRENESLRSELKLCRAALKAISG